MNHDAAFLPPHCNYRDLLSCRKAEIVYDLSYRIRDFVKEGELRERMVRARRQYRGGAQGLSQSTK
jgi:hypothetical protein